MIFSSEIHSVLVISLWLCCNTWSKIFKGEEFILVHNCKRSFFEKGRHENNSQRSACHNASTIRKQRVKKAHRYSAFSLFFLQSMTLTQEVVLPAFRKRHPDQLFFFTIDLDEISAQ